MSFSKKLGLLGLLVLATFFLGACVHSSDEETAANDNTIVIGSVLPLTGDGAAYGLPTQRTAMLALAEINAAGGVKGKTLEVVWEDGQCKGEASASAAQKLINIDKVKLILGGACSSETLGMAPIAEANKVLVFSPLSTNPKITEAGDFIFRNAPSDSSQGFVEANAAYEAGYRKAGVVHEQSDYAVGVKDAFAKRFQELGGEVVVESYTSDAPDVRTQVLKLKAADPDVVVVIPQTPAKGDILFRELQKQGVELPLVANEVVAGDFALLEKYADYLEGMITADLAYDPASPQFQQMTDGYKATYGQEVPYVSYMANTYDAVYLLAEAIGAVGYDAEKIRDYLYNVQDWKGAEGTLNFTKDGDPQAGFLLKTVRAGKLVDAE